jgi:hypothetical protein
MAGLDHKIRSRNPQPREKLKKEHMYTLSFNHSVSRLIHGTVWLHHTIPHEDIEVG